MDNANVIQETLTTGIAGEYDVVVCGGGFAGISAALAACLFLGGTAAVTGAEAKAAPAKAPAKAEVKAAPAKAAPAKVAECGNQSGTGSTEIGSCVAETPSG